MYDNECLSEEFQKIIKLVRFISQEHIVFTKEFLARQQHTPSLKNKQLRNFLSEDSKNNKNIEIDINFLKYILKYTEELEEFYTTKLLNRLTEENISFNHIRGKNKDSIISKVFHYRFGKNEKGQIATNKCLNDLLGFRIYIDEIKNYDSFTENLKTIIGTKDKINNRLKFNNSCKGNYKAVHIYFKGIDNKYFPWELQIWEKHQEKDNLDSHKNHKLGYLEWKEFASDDIIKIVER